MKAIPLNHVHSGQLLPALLFARQLLRELRRLEDQESGLCVPFHPSPILETLHCARINAELAVDFLEDQIPQAVLAANPESK